MKQNTARSGFLVFLLERSRFSHKGFTLIELMVVIAVIAVLAAIALFGLRQAQASARDTSRMQIMSSIRAQLEKYYGDNNGYPVTTSFAGTGAMLSTIGYATANLADPGCGSGPIAFAAPASAGNWSPTAVGCTFSTQPVYAYNGPAGGASYTLTLTKEGGGQKTFTNPK